MIDWGRTESLVGGGGQHFLNWARQYSGSRYDKTGLEQWMQHFKWRNKVCEVIKVRSDFILETISSLKFIIRLLNWFISKGNWWCTNMLREQTKTLQEFWFTQTDENKRIGITELVCKSEPFYLSSKNCLLGIEESLGSILYSEDFKKLNHLL